MNKVKRLGTLALLLFIGTLALGRVAIGDSDICHTLNRCKDATWCSPCGETDYDCGIWTDGSGASECEDHRYRNVAMEGADLVRVTGAMCFPCTYARPCVRKSAQCYSKPSWNECMPDISVPVSAIGGWSQWIEGGVCEVK